jgi:hypothetical protein
MKLMIGHNRTSSARSADRIVSQFSGLSKKCIAGPSQMEETK